MELNQITEERLQELALLPEEAWTAQERSLVAADPGLRAELEAYQMLFGDLRDFEEPQFSPGFEAGILAQLPETSPEAAPGGFRAPEWLRWTGLAAGIAGILAVTAAIFPQVLPPVGSGPDLGPLQQMAADLSQPLADNGLLIGAGAAAILGTALLDKYLRRNSKRHFQL